MFRTPDKDLLEEWPAHYFETDDIHAREEALNQRIRAISDPEDVRRLEVLHLRFGTGKRQRPDGFMRAWLMLKVMAVNSGNSPFSRKKHQEVYALLESFGIREGETPDEVLIVGDSLTSDMQGGNNAGIRCCWYNPKGKPNDTAVRPTYEIRTLTQLLSIIG